MTDHLEDRLILYLYDELDAGERHTIETLLAESAEARERLAELRRLHDHISAEAPPIDPAALTILRRGVMSRIETEAGHTADFHRASPFLQMAAALLLLVLGGISGWLIRGGDRPGDGGDTRVNAGSALGKRNAALDPRLAAIEKLSFDPATGAIDIHFTTVNSGRYSGDINDPAVQSMLRSAIADAGNPSVRLHAVKAMRSAADRDPGATLSPELVPLLVRLLDREPNLGIRLKVIELLGSRPNDPLVTAALNRVLSAGQPRALQVAALKVMALDGLNPVEQALLARMARSDTTGYFRNALRDADSTRIDPIPGATERRRIGGSANDNL